MAIQNGHYHPKVEIKTNGATAEIFIDGEPMSGVTAYKIEQSVNEMAELTVMLITADLEITGDANIKKNKSN